MKYLLSLFVAVQSLLLVTAQNLQSPEQFLGYPIGTKYSRHHQIIDYCKYVAVTKPSLVKYEKYGETNERRELALLYISSAENMQKLAAIQANNIALAGLSKSSSSGSTNAPAIVWLSYNVHGNETSSSEAAMLTLYTLANYEKPEVQEWLKNTVVIIDPCLNPDGRDRYVNWYNSMVGKNYNANPQTREHIEPWPGGRSNHYNFDLNRDWAWQTQIETKQRVAKYLQWMPQIHVDFHEQGYNEPYYFAPAAEPFHEVITPWQRNFQTQIGKNNARYFDANGWLYFTKERFDLFYPSYGDTYPTFNGAIGMTYEQGGGGRGGLGVITEDADTLTLIDRAQHHYTTGLSTIETASKNANQLIAEFKKYFDNNNTAKGFLYKTYIITSDNETKIKAFEKMLQQNGIAYGTTNVTAAKGVNFATLKEETVATKKHTIAVSMLQPRSSMATVLLEPKGNLSDSNTYDITAWALPYAFGVDAYAVKEALPVTGKAITGVMPTVIPVSTYGYAMQYGTLNSVQALAYLLKNGIKVKVSSKPFSIGTNNFDRGTLIILHAGNKNVHEHLQIAHRKFDAAIMPLSSGFVDKGADFGSPDVGIMHAPKIAMLSGEQTSSLGSGEVWNYFDQIIDYPVSVFNAADFGRVNLKDYNVLVIPDGNYRNLSDKVIVDKLKEFARTGGTIIALENAVSIMASGDWGLKNKEVKDEKDKDEYAAIKKYADRERSYLNNSIPGAIFKVNIDDTHPLGYGLGNTYYTLKQDDNIYQFLKDGWNVGVLKKDSYVAGFAGINVKAKLKDGVLFGVQEYGQGNIVYLTDNPLFRLFWENGKMLFANAVFMVGK